MIRGIIQSCIEGVIKRLTASGRPGETIADREYFQHYGYTSRPLAGAEVIIIREGGHFLAIASDDRRYRIALEEGEVAVYDSLGQKAHLKADGTIDIVAINQLNITAPKIHFETALLEVSGNIKTLAGNITSYNHVLDQNGTKSMAGMRVNYNNHHHGGSALPDQSM